MESIETWNENPKIGKKERIFTKEEINGLVLYSCPNKITIFTNPSKLEIQHNLTVGQKVKKNTNFLKIKGEDFFLPFNFSIIELKKDINNYFLIILRAK